MGRKEAGPLCALADPFNLNRGFSLLVSHASVCSVGFLASWVNTPFGVGS